MELLRYVRSFHTNQYLQPQHLIQTDHFLDLGSIYLVLPKSFERSCRTSINVFFWLLLDWALRSERTVITQQCIT